MSEGHKNPFTLCPVSGTLPSMNKSRHKQAVPTGNPWSPSENDPATVPVPLPVIIVKVEGRYTERDRKLWTFLLCALWNELGEKPIHELPVSKINQVFRELGGDHNTTWIWESAGRLTRTIIEWIRTEGDVRYKGISSLFSAEISDEAKKEGVLRFAFPPLLIPILKDPRRFARLRVHFLIGLSGKYAVTLYELLESVANKQEPVLDVQLDTLRNWLKVPEGKLTRWIHFNQRVLDPAIRQINANPLGAGFTVDTQPLKKGKAVDRIRFTIHKIDERLALEEILQENKTSQCPEVSSDPDPIRLSTTDYEKAKKAAPGWDIYYLEQEWRRWLATREKPKTPPAAFIAFCRKKYQAHNPSSKHPAQAGSTRPG
jgi:hypothetical protein